jgi:hypothetical protein
MTLLADSFKDHNPELAAESILNEYIRTVTTNAAATSDVHGDAETRNDLKNRLDKLEQDFRDAAGGHLDRAEKLERENRRLRGVLAVLVSCAGAAGLSLLYPWTYSLFGRLVSVALLAGTCILAGLLGAKSLARMPRLTRGILLAMAATATLVTLDMVLKWETFPRLVGAASLAASLFLTGANEATRREQRTERIETQRRRLSTPAANSPQTAV